VPFRTYLRRKVSPSFFSDDNLLLLGFPCLAVKDLEKPPLSELLLFRTGYFQTLCMVREAFARDVRFCCSSLIFLRTKAPCSGRHPAPSPVLSGGEDACATSLPWAVRPLTLDEGRTAALLSGRDLRVPGQALVRFPRNPQANQDEVCAVAVASSSFFPPLIDLSPPFHAAPQLAKKLRLSAFFKSPRPPFLPSFTTFISAVIFPESLPLEESLRPPLFPPALIFALTIVPRCAGNPIDAGREPTITHIW